MKAVAILTFAMTCQSIPVEHDLDLLTYRLTPSPPAPPGVSTVGEGWSMGTSDGPPPEALTVKLVSLNSGVYNPGDVIIYEMILENSGHKSITLPWSPDYVLFADTEPDESAFLGLEVHDAAGRLLGLLEAHRLDGKREIQDSLLTLAPGERARIRVPSQWLSRLWDRCDAAPARRPRSDIRILLDQPGASRHPFLQEQEHCRHAVAAPCALTRDGHDL